MRRLIIYVHGKGGNAEEAKHYQLLFPDSDVIGFVFYLIQIGSQKFTIKLVGIHMRTLFDFFIDINQAAVVFF